MTHDVIISTVGEHLTKIVNENEVFSLHIVRDEAGDWSAVYQGENDRTLEGTVTYGKNLTELLENLRLGVTA